MQALINPVSPLPLYRQVERFIEQDLIQGQNLQPNDLIPSLAELSRRLKVNNLTVRRAISELSQRRLLVTRQGRGTFVAEGARRRVLWLNGVEALQAGPVGFYQDLFEQAIAEFKEQGLDLESAWVPRDQPALVERCRRELNSPGYVGFALCACPPIHPLLQVIRESDRPYVNFSSYQDSQRWSVFPDMPAGDRIALQHLKTQGQRRASVIKLRGNSPWLEELAAGLDLEVDIYELESRVQRPAQLGQTAMQLAFRLMDDNRLAPALYITDDVLAQGVSRALLARQPAALSSMQIVVRCAKQEATDLGLPVAYVVHDIREQVREGVRLLVNQIQDREEEGDYFLCPYRLYQPGELPPSLAQPRPSLSQSRSSNQLKGVLA